MYSRNWKLVITLHCFLLMLAAAQVVGQSTTQPAPAGWDERVNNLIKTLSDEPDDSRVQDALAADEGLVFQKLGSISSRGGTDPLSDLRQRIGASKVISSRIYSWPAETIASDLAADARACQAMPEQLRRQFVTKDDADAKRANITAQQWIMMTLRPAADDPIAVVLLWEPPPSLTATLLINAGAPQQQQQQIKPPVFLLIKGRKLDDGQFRITQISYGDSRQVAS